MPVQQGFCKASCADIVMLIIRPCEFCIKAWPEYCVIVQSAVHSACVAPTGAQHDLPVGILVIVFKITVKTLGIPIIAKAFPYSIHDLCHAAESGEGCPVMVGFEEKLFLGVPYPL